MIQRGSERSKSTLFAANILVQEVKGLTGDEGLTDVSKLLSFKGSSLPLPAFQERRDRSEDCADPDVSAFGAGIGEKEGLRLLLNLSSHLISPPKASLHVES